MFKLLKKSIQLVLAHERQMLIGLFILALGLRLAAVAYLGVPDPVKDSESGQIARNLTQGAGYTFDFYSYRTETPLRAFIPPLYPLLLYVAFRWRPDPATALGVAQSFNSFFSSLPA